MTMRFVLAVSALALLAGCNDAGKTKAAKAAGSVVATVDGTEITTGDLDAEARARGVTFDTRDGDKARAAVLRFVVSRQMLVDQAIAARRDNDPKLLADRRRMDASLVSQGEIALLMKQAPAITDRQIAVYQAANPYVFAKRQTLTVDQTQVMPRGPLPKGGRDTSFALMEQLATLQLPTKRARIQLDSADLPAAAVDALLQHPEVPVQVDNGAVTTFLEFVSATPNPAPPAEQKQAAIRVLQGQWLDKTISDKVDALGKDGKITYQPGYAPSSAHPTTSPTGAVPAH